MKHVVNEKLEINIKEFKSYKVSKAVKLALLNWVIVKWWEAPEVPAENAVKSEEALITWMTWLTLKELEELTEEEYDWILNKINEICKVPTQAS